MDRHHDSDAQRPLRIVPPQVPALQRRKPPVRAAASLQLSGGHT